MTINHAEAERGDDDTVAAETRSIVVISAGTSDPSSSRLPADRIARSTLDHLRGHDVAAAGSVIELRPLAVDIAGALVSGLPSERLQAAIGRLAAADAIIAVTPIYKAGVSGLFKSFVDILDNDLLIAKPVLIAATAGSARHAMAVDEQLRPLFAFMRALTTPTSIFAAPEDWADPLLGSRIERAATELTAMIMSGITTMITDGAWGRYQHSFASNARPEEAADIDLDTDLMRLATGGKRA